MSVAATKSARARSVERPGDADAVAHRMPRNRGADRIMVGSAQQVARIRDVKAPRILRRRPAGERIQQPLELGGIRHLVEHRNEQLVVADPQRSA